jgi:two-component sensor histidine kinase
MDQMELRISARQPVSNTEMMAREIDHTVMNTATLAMQGRSPSLMDAASQLQSASERVAVVACVHQQFYMG